MINFIKGYFLVTLWAIIVITLCAMPQKSFNGTPHFEGMDKLAHTGFFFVFSTLMYFGNGYYFGHRMSKFWSIVLVVAFSILFGLFTEGIQKYIFTHRSADLWDLFADLVGTGMGSFAFLVLYRQPRSLSYK